MANKKYPFLDDIDWLLKELETKSMSELAEELSKMHQIPKNVLQSCIRFRLKRYCSKTQIDSVKKLRKFHTNNKV